MIFVDTSAIFALASAVDVNHDKARRRFDALLRTRRPLLTHNYVLSESMALLRRRLGQESALAFASEARAFEVAWVDKSQHDAAVAALRHAPRSMSLVDAVSFLVMRQRGIDEAFAFDRHFVAAGFRLYDA